MRGIWDNIVNLYEYILHRQNIAILKYAMQPE